MDCVRQYSGHTFHFIEPSRRGLSGGSPHRKRASDRRRHLMHAVLRRQVGEGGRLYDLVPDLKAREQTRSQA
eukprot:1859115-Prymnesium_polylepis.2